MIHNINTVDLKRNFRNSLIYHSASFKDLSSIFKKVPMISNTLMISKLRKSKNYLSYWTNTKKIPYHMRLINSTYSSQEIEKTSLMTSICLEMLLSMTSMLSIGITDKSFTTNWMTFRDVMNKILKCNSSIL